MKTEEEIRKLLNITTAFKDGFEQLGFTRFDSDSMKIMQDTLKWVLEEE